MDPAPRRGRRDNGLDAAAFIPLADVDPRVGEHLLDVLAAAGVPAYLEPSADVEPYTRTLALPSPPTDRLWVDREQRITARQIVETEAEQAGQTGLGRAGREHGGPALGPDDTGSTSLQDDEELIWRQIVASYEAEPAAPVPPWPVAEDGDEPAGRGGAAPATDPDGDPDDRPRWRRGAADGAAGAEDPLPAPEEDEEEHYVPPPPPPVPRPSRQAVLALVLLLIGLVLVFAPGQVGLDEGAGLTFGVGAILSGTVVLILRLRDSRSDDGPDDGAVV
jgi:hypothetical protein